MTTMARIAQIRTALARVKESREHYRLVSANQSVESLHKQSAEDAFTAAVKEFGWQWINVEAVLDALPPETK
jgi:hypothetical protein